MIDREISRRELFTRTGGAIAGLTLAASGLSFGQETEQRRRPRGFRIGVCDWTINKRTDPTVFALAKKIGLEDVQVDVGEGEKEPPLFTHQSQTR